MDLELSADDYTLLKHVLERYISDLRGEIAGTENAEWRKGMHADEDRAKQLLARLDQPQASPDRAAQLEIVVRGYAVRV